MNFNLPFERNRYYLGKMLTSADFEAEQKYHNGKRNFLNYMMYGSGIVCGLGINEIDDLSILIDSGMAIDSEGREIIVGNSIVKKLSAIDGFEKLETNKARLFIRYVEEETMPVYSLEKSGGTDKYENNRIAEKYEFFIKDSKLQGKTDNGALLQKHIFLYNPDYSVTIYVPNIMCMGKMAKICVNVLKRSDRAVKLSFEGVLQLPQMKAEDGSHELEISMNNIVLKKDREINAEYWVEVEQADTDRTDIILKSQSAKAYVGDYEVKTTEKLSIPVELSNMSPSQVSRRVGAERTLEDVTKDTQDGVPLCEFELIKTEGAYIIDSISTEDIRKYVPTIAADSVRNEYESYFRNIDDEFGFIGQARKNDDGNKAVFYQPNRMASGTIEIPLKPNMKKGDICYSEEIMHGLGSGDVYVDVGIEHFEDGHMKLSDDKRTVFGDPSMFEDNALVSMQTAVEVYNNRGSFRVAVRLLGEQKSIVAIISWIAIRVMPVEEKLKEVRENQSIIPETPTVRLSAREDFYFNVRFENMKPMRLSYELTESGSGEITPDGIYTAPNEEGVYEIHIYCTDLPEISTYAYAIVSRAVETVKDEG
ncbi:MAG: hypothetical protein K6G84_07100 [Lachnospiraceae bacterium]|nr:hypothetical protein [Lachnospiraceae bacterium]